mmetsp:Transcript_24569/g.67820  ORF Transcript_24569/g.67820 Transcript_24569/m.67820 type:complete len:136 (-) Transcript_24569:193-600(-)
MEFIDTRNTTDLNATERRVGHNNCPDVGIELLQPDEFRHRTNRTLSRGYDRVFGLFICKDRSMPGRMIRTTSILMVTLADPEVYQHPNTLPATPAVTWISIHQTSFGISRRWNGISNHSIVLAKVFPWRWIECVQ